MNPIDAAISAMLDAQSAAAARLHAMSVGEDVQAAAKDLREDDGIAHGQALSLAADTVAHDRGDVSATQALAFAKALVG